MYPGVFIKVSFAVEVISNQQGQGCHAVCKKIKPDKTGVTIALIRLWRQGSEAVVTPSPSPTLILISALGKEESLASGQNPSEIWDPAASTWSRLGWQNYKQTVFHNALWRDLEAVDSRAGSHWQLLPSGCHSELSSVHP